MHRPPALRAAGRASAPRPAKASPLTRREAVRKPESLTSATDGPPSFARWKELQWTDKDLAQVGIELKSELMRPPGWLGEFSRATSCTTSPTATQERPSRYGNLLPLPVPDETVEEKEWALRIRGEPIADLGEKSDAVLRRVAGVQAWTWCMVAGLNFVHEGRGQAACASFRHRGPATEAQEKALSDLRADAMYFLESHGGAVPAMDWGRELGVRRVRYDGEEIGAAQPLTLERMLPALPGLGHCGRICATEIATGQVKELLLDPELTLRPRAEWESLSLRARCMHDRADRDSIVDTLLDRGMCALVPRRDLASTTAGPVANGWFGVGKGKYLPSREAVPENEILRFIMHFVPVNTLLYPMEGDVSCLPYFGQWSALQVESWQYFAWSSEDIACMCYIFRLPPVWRPYMSFNCGKITPEGGEEHALCAAVLGMGWLSSVGVAQHLIRELALRAPRLGAGLPAAAELRRDADPPQGVSSAGAASFWSVYMDDFDVCEVAEKEAIVAKLGEVHQWQSLIRSAYEEWGIPRGADKAVCQSLRVERLGAALDGADGRAHGTPKRMLQLVSLLLYVLQCEAIPRTLLEMIVGRFVHRMQFRRPCMGFLSRVWKYLRRWGRHRSLPREVEEDLLLGLCSAPLMYMDFRAPVDEKVTCSDASPTGNGVCVSSGVTEEGRALAAALREAPARAKGCGPNLLLVSLFDGIGGLRRSVEVVGIPVVGSVAVEIDEVCRRVVAEAWPDTVQLNKGHQPSRRRLREAAPSAVPSDHENITRGRFPTPGAQLGMQGRRQQLRVALPPGRAGWEAP